MAQRVLSSQKMLEQKKEAQAQQGNFAKAEFVNLKPDPATGETVRNLRIIGFPVTFRQFTDKKRKEGGEKGATVRVPFPDAHLNSNFTRIGTGNDPAYGECPWQKLGYISSQRYAVNVLERQKDGSCVVKILEKGGSIFNKFIEYETTNRETNLENPDEDPLCVMLGGAVAHDVRIKAKANPQALGGVEYVVSVAPRPSKVTEEEIEMLAAIGTPKPEEIANERAAYEALRQEDPQLPDWEDWFLYGYNLSNIFKPTPIKTESNTAPAATAEATDSEELVIDDTPEPVAAAPAKAPTKTKKAASAPAEELANPFDEEEGAVAVAVASDEDGEPDWD